MARTETKPLNKEGGFLSSKSIDGQRRKIMRKFRFKDLDNEMTAWTVSRALETIDAVGDLDL